MLVYIQEKWERYTTHLYTYNYSKKKKISYWDSTLIFLFWNHLSLLFPLLFSMPAKTTIHRSLAFWHYLFLLASSLICFWSHSTWFPLPIYKMVILESHTNWFHRIFVWCGIPKRCKAVARTATKLSKKKLVSVALLDFV